MCRGSMIVFARVLRVRIPAGILRVALIFLILSASIMPLSADTVDFVDGNRIENVRVLFLGGRVNLIFEGGAIQVYREEQIARIHNVSVNWEVGVDEAEFEREARERIVKTQEQIRTRERQRLEREGQERRFVLYLSLAFPGLGQLVNGSDVRGIFFASSAVAFGAGVAGAQKRVRKAILSYESRLLPYSIATLGAPHGLLSVYILEDLHFRSRSAVIRENRKVRDGLGIGLAVIWILSAVDAYFFADLGHLNEQSQEPLIDEVIWPDVQISQTHVNITWSFIL